jgi:DNA-binding LacI/PurR family transcriptional regulator
VTLGEIARAAGVSRSTVSRAMAESQLISKAQRERIQKLALEMGYRPDPEASRLLAHFKRSQFNPVISVIGVLNAYDPPAAMTRDTYTARLLQAAQSRAHELGFALDELSLCGEGMSPKRLNQIIRARNIRGILIPPEPNPLFQAPLEWGSVCAVATTTTVEPLRLHRVLPHNFNNFERLLEGIHHLGYRRPAFIGWSELEKRQMNAPTAVLARAVYIEKRFEAIPPFSWRWDHPPTIKKFNDWFRRSRPDVVIAPAHWHLKHLRETLGVRVPKDLGYVSYVETNPEISQIIEGPEVVGSAAIDLISAHVLRGETGIPTHPKTLLIEGHFKAARTTRRQR